MLKNILVPIDGSKKSYAAMEYGIWLAQEFKGRLMGQHVIDAVLIEGTMFHDISDSLSIEPYLDFPTRMREILEERGTAMLDEFGRRCAAKKITHETVLDMGVVADEICERALLADLVVMGGRGTSDDARPGILGRTADSVTRKCSRPVLVSNDPFKPIQKTLLAYDGSQRASAALELAAQFCTELGIPLTVLHVARSDKGTDADTDPVLTAARKYLASYAVKVSFQLERGYPEERIIQQLTHDEYDVLFIGAYGHRRIIEMVLGSTTEYVLRKSPCPVLLKR